MTTLTKTQIIHELLINCCKTGNICLAQGIYYDYPDIIIDFDNNYLFRTACGRNQIDIAKWLYSVCPTMDISIHYDITFRYACSAGFMHIAKWLVEIGESIKKPIDISAIDNFAFEYASRNGHIEICN